MITDKDLIEHFGLSPDEGEILEHYGRKGMKWGQRIFSGARSLNNKRRARKQARRERKAAKLESRRAAKAAKKNNIKHIKNIKRIAGDLGSLSDADIKALATRLDNEAKIRKHAENVQKYLPPSKIDQTVKLAKRIGDLPLPMANYDSKGKLTGYTTDGTVKDYVFKAAIQAGTAYMNRQVNAEHMSATFRHAKNVMAQYKEDRN